jgi:hypothetical protein
MLFPCGVIPMALPLKINTVNHPSLPWAFPKIMSRRRSIRLATRGCYDPFTSAENIS